MHRHLISIRGLDDGELDYLVRRGIWFAEEQATGYRPLTGMVVGSFFRKTSTRTRTAFASAALRLGAGHIAYGPEDLQLVTGESIEDTARVFARMLDALVVRTAADPADVQALAAQRSVAVINAMSADEHPTQAVADLTTLMRRFGRVDGLRIVYIGEGNNTAVALVLGLARFHDVELCLVTPPGYGVTEDLLDLAQAQAGARGSRITQCHELGKALTGADVVYTTRWQTTGTSKADPEWQRFFEPFQVNEALMERHPEAVLMHDLPAHRGEEVTREVLDGRSSIVFDQAENKMHSAMAVLEWSILGGQS